MRAGRRIQAGRRGIVPLITAAFLLCFSVKFLFHEALKLCPWGLIFYYYLITIWFRRIRLVMPF